MVDNFSLIQETIHFLEKHQPNTWIIDPDVQFSDQCDNCNKTTTDRLFFTKVGNPISWQENPNPVAGPLKNFYTGFCVKCMTKGLHEGTITVKKVNESDSCPLCNERGNDKDHKGKFNRTPCYICNKVDASDERIISCLFYAHVGRFHFEMFLCWDHFVYHLINDVQMQRNIINFWSDEAVERSKRHLNLHYGKSLKLKPPTFKKTIKIVIVGDKGVGKTTLVNTITHEMRNNSHYTIQIWDDDSSHEYYNKIGVADAAIYCYDLVDIVTMWNLGRWKDYIHYAVPLFFVGTKNDLAKLDKNGITMKEEEKKYKFHSYFLSSVTHPQSLLEGFESILDYVYADKENLVEIQLIVLQYPS